MFRRNHSTLHVLPEKLGLLLITQDFRGSLSTAYLAATSTRRTSKTAALQFSWALQTEHDQEVWRPYQQRKELAVAAAAPQW